MRFRYKGKNIYSNIRILTITLKLYVENRGEWTYAGSEPLKLKKICRKITRNPTYAPTALTESSNVPNPNQTNNLTNCVYMLYSYQSTKVDNFSIKYTPFDWLKKWFVDSIKEEQLLNFPFCSNNGYYTNPKNENS